MINANLYFYQLNPIKLLMALAFIKDTVIIYKTISNDYIMYPFILLRYMYKDIFFVFHILKDILMFI